MNGKKAKELRQNAKKVAVNINILALEDGGMTITGFPTNPYATLDIMGTAMKVMAQKLFQLSQGEKPLVMPVTSPIVGPDGQRLN